MLDFIQIIIFQLKKFKFPKILILLNKSLIFIILFCLIVVKLFMLDFLLYIFIIYLFLNFIKFLLYLLLLPNN